MHASMLYCTVPRGNEGRCGAMRALWYRVVSRVPWCQLVPYAGHAESQPNRHVSLPPVRRDERVARVHSPR